MINKKQFIIDSYLKNKSLDFDKFAEYNCINSSYVTKVITEYRKEISTSYPIFCEKSLDLSGVYYLFSDGEEKKIEVVNDIIEQPNNLTDYEKKWLEVNKNFYE